MTGSLEGHIDTFWRFSLDRYGRAGVADHCLLLQDELGIDVNILLLCLWAADLGCLLPRDRLAALDAGEAGRWHRDIVRPLRAARRTMKGRAAVGDVDQVETVRNRLKAVEIETERLEQRLLAAAVVPALPAVGEARPATGDRRRIARANVATYLDLLPGERTASHADAVDALVTACLD